MRFHADLHIHSKYSRATSKQSDLEHFAYWARKKGVAVVATGDFTHPAWLAELKEKLVPAEPGLYNEYHALIVRHVKERCRKVPLCGQCTLRTRCPSRAGL